MKLTIFLCFLLAGPTSSFLLSGLGQLAGDIIGGAGKLVGDTVNTAGQILGGTANLAGQVIGGTIDAAGQLTGGVLHAAGDVVKGTVNLAGGVVNTALCVTTLGILGSCKGRPGGGLSPLPIQCKALADVYLVLDASSSIGSNNYKKQLAFLANMAASFIHGDNDARFAEIYFSDNAQKHFDFSTYPDPASLLTAILSTPYPGGSTATDTALDAINNFDLFSAKFGGRTKAGDVIIVVTDGRSNSPAATERAAARLRAKGVTIFAIGVGQTFLGLNIFGNSNHELLKLASSPDYVFLANDYDTLENVLYQLVQRTCKATGGKEIIPGQPDEPDYPEQGQEPECTAVVDFLLVVDSSGSIGPKNYQKLLDFLQQLVSHFKVGTRDVLFGCVLFSNVAQKYFDLKDNTNIRSLKLAIQAMGYLNSTTKTNEALDLIMSAGMFRPEAGARRSAKKMVAVITDGLSDKPALTKISANNLKQQGVQVIAVGIGKAEDSELRAIASDVSSVFKTSNFDALKLIVDDVTEKACS